MQETPSGALPFFHCCRKKEESSTGPRWVSCIANRWVGSHPQIWDGDLAQILEVTRLSHLQVRKTALYFCRLFYPFLVESCCLSRSSPTPSKKKKGTRTDGSITLTPLTLFQTPLLVHSPAIPSKHTCVAGRAVH